ESLANVGSWELNLVKNELTWSGGVFMLLGYKPFEFKVTFNVGVEIIHPDDRQRALNHMQEALESNKPYYIKKRLIGNKNQIKYVVSKAEVIRNKKGKPVKLIGIFKDITDLVLAENENKRHLSDLNERIKEQNCLFNIANLAANHQNINSYLTEVCKIIPTGFQIPEKAQAQIQFKGKKYNSNSQKSSTKSLSVSGTTSNNNKILIAVYYTGKINLPGNKLFLNEEKVLLNTVLKSLILKIDQIEAYNNYELLLQSTQEGVYGIDTNGNCIFINKAAQKLLGYKQHEVLGKNMHKLVHYKTIDNKPVSEEKCPICVAAKKNASCEVPFDYFFTKSKSSLP